ncbi:uncharacterized protein B0I36DRAFT_318991 [Microdochium trichocladiopsis]|uniref:Secreted protein n=1 Tax=Microdochium trichocladiopsis TaxID=1682393 RepID=A0A9P8Y9W4_9PEZI|nr:uncharacterized protein B0I36DRAFT_318991 [Microdochium trichocladiopsis]KAH7035734.1 hypothetical protein B0I36DRAFT_318991 [Microdochium trichocladiopsis]
MPLFPPRWWRCIESSSIGLSLCLSASLRCTKADTSALGHNNPCHTGEDESMALSARVKACLLAVACPIHALRSRTVTFGKGKWLSLRRVFVFLLEVTCWSYFDLSG